MLKFVLLCLESALSIMIRCCCPDPSKIVYNKAAYKEWEERLSAVAGVYLTYRY